VKIVTPFLSLIGSIASVALIAIATRWLATAKGAQFPRTNNGTNVYGTKRAWRVVGLGGVGFFVILLIWSWIDLRHPDFVMASISPIFILAGLWMGIGSVTTDQGGITKRTIWRSRSLRWEEITEIRFFGKGTLDLRAGSRILSVDSRVNAFQHLIEEIKEHTRLPPTEK
jgi:hypothetical protein